MSALYRVRCYECGRVVIVCAHTAQRVADGRSFMLCDHCVDRLLTSEASDTTDEVAKQIV